jgi:enolase-phosphatase E1
VDFVYRTLFPFARAKVEDFLLRHANDPAVLADVELLRRQSSADQERGLDVPPWRGGSANIALASAALYARWLIDRDSKCTPLKSLQGRIWEEGYRSGELHGEVYSDVPPALRRWTEHDKSIAIYSSGSVLAQKLLFENSVAGNLAPFLRAYFDTTTGVKTAAHSYAKIAAALALSPSEILFISDLHRELHAARQAGMSTLLCARGESGALAAKASLAADHAVIHSLDQVLP